MSQPRRTAPLLLLAGLLALLIGVAPVHRLKAAEPAQGPASAPFLEKDWAQPTVREESTRNWIEKNAIKYLEDRGQPVLPAFYPLAVRNKVLFRSYWGVHAVNLQTGKLEWESDSRWSVDRMMRDPGKTNPLNQWLTGFLSVGRPALILENSTLGTLSTDGSRLFAVEDLAVPPFRNPGPGQPPPPMTGYGAALDDAVNHSRLQAYDLETGKLVWELGGRGGKDELSDSYFLAAPLVVDGKLFVLNEKQGDLRLLCLEPVKGGILWIQHLASFREPLGQDPYRRIRAASVAYADGVLVCPTNSGVLLAVDVRARSLLWMHAYREPDSVAPMPEQQQAQPQPPGIAPFLSFSWKVTPPVIADGKVVYTPPDGLSLVCLNLLDGSLAWKVRAGQDDLYLGGVQGGKVVIVSRKACRAVSLADGKLLWTLETGLPSGRGMAVGNLYYLPLKADPQTREPEVCAIDVDRGRIFARTRSPKNEVAGNLFFHDGVVISQTAEQVVVYPQLSAKLADVEERLRKEPKDPIGLTERAQLRLGKGDTQGAIDDLHLVLAGNPPQEVRGKARGTLYEAETALLQSGFAAAEKYLDELADLCKIDIPDSATPRERQELRAEQQRRRADYYFLVAQGREGQGRPLDALQAYLDFVGTAGSEEAMSAPEDPAAKAPRDVWVGGRIAALLAAATPEQRRRLEEVSATRWKAAQAGGDIQAVQHFVRVFGAGSAFGRDARLALAERLAQDNAFMEAELQLLQVRGQTDDPSQAARALEALAGLYTRKGLLDDAAYCYRVLGRDFATTVVRDGKTGADILQELSTDKRFLPYLEEPGATPGKRLKAKVERGTVMQPQQLYVFEPEGEVLPFFQRQRLALDLLYHKIKLLDRRNNEEHWAQNLTRTNFQNFINAGNPAQPFRARYQVVGHLAVLNLGNMVFALDPISHRVLWEKNLLGSDAALNPINVVADPTDGTPQIIYQDGYVQKLGQVCTLDARALCLQTRDGLIAVDPYTGATLWSRADIAMLTRFFSDGRHIYLVELGADGQPSGTRALRAADGVEVHVPDFTAAYARRLAVLGHNLLLSDPDSKGDVVLHLYDIGTGKDVWRTAFPAGSRVLHSETPGLAGAITPDGKVTVVDLRTQREVLSADIDQKRLGQAKLVRLLGDRSSIYLACSAPVDMTVFPMGGPFPAVFPGSGIPSVPASGRVFAFDRADGKKHWEADVADQRLLLDQFEDLPVLIFATMYQKVVNNQFVTQGLAVKIIDKATGKLLFDEDGPNNGQQFVLLNWNPDLRTTELLGVNMKITVGPEK